jgi:glycosyltransferase involved in cell wall biosynthesis
VSKGCNNRIGKQINGDDNVLDNPVIDISVIVAVGRTDLKRCLDSLLSQTLSADQYEIILVTNAPLNTEATDNLVNLAVSEDNPALKRNAGARAARGALLAFIDDDAWAREDWLENACRFMKTYPGASGVGGPRVLPSGASFREKATDILANSKFFGNGHGNWREMRVSNRVPHGMINSCNYVVRRDTFLALGGYNESIGYGGEDTEFIYRAVRDARCLFAYTWDMIVYHPPRPFGWKLIRQRFRYRVQNGKMLWVYPRIYMSNWTFCLGLCGITGFLAASLVWSLVFPVGLALYIVCTLIVSLHYVRYDARFMLILPPAFFVHHVVYYFAIWEGFLTGLFDRRFIHDIKNANMEPYKLLDRISVDDGREFEVES